MFANMMEQPLLISSLLVHAERHHGEREIVSRRVEGDIHRSNYRELARRRLPRTDQRESAIISGFLRSSLRLTTRRRRRRGGRR